MSAPAAITPAPPIVSPPPGLIARAGYGFTSVVENTKFQVYETFLLFYYAQVLGLAGSLAGLAVGIAVMVDAVTDPLIGSFSDGLRSRFGRRHALMFLAIVPTGVFLYLLFRPPAGLHGTGLFAWLLALCIAARISGSFYAVPAAAIGAELTDRDTIRSELGIWRQAIASLSQLGLIWLVFHLAFTPAPGYPRGQENPDNYPAFALIVAVVIAVGALIGALATRSPLREFEQQRLPAQPRTFSVKGTLLATCRAFADLANIRALFLGLLCAGVMGSYFRALNLYLGTYFWELSTQQTGAWLNSVQIATFVAAVASRLVVGRLEPRSLYVAGVAIMLAAYVAPPLARLADVLPPNGSAALLALLYAANVAVGVGTGLIMSCSLVLFAEAADEYALDRGESRTGMLLALLPLGNKIASSVGKIAAGVVVQWVSLPIAPRGGAGQVATVASAATLRQFGFAAAGVTLVAGLAALYFFMRYRLPRSRHAEILRGLADLRALRAGKEA